TDVRELWLDDTQYIGARGSIMYISAGARKTDFLGGSVPNSIPEFVSGVWLYRATPPSGDQSGGAVSPAKDPVEWRQASGKVPLRSQIDPDGLRQLKTEPGQHRFYLRVTF